MAVYKNTRGVWQFVVWIKLNDGSKKQVKRENNKWLKKDAVAAEKEFLKNTFNVSDDITFQSLSRQFIESKKEKLKQRTILTYQDIINTHIFPYFKNKQISHILKSDIRKWQKTLKEKNLSNSYTLSIQSLIKEIFNWAEKNDFLEKSPFIHDRVHSMKTHREISYLTHDEYHKFSECIDSFEDEIIFDVLYWCGVRKGELMALRFSDVDLLNQSIHISKNYDTRNHITTAPKNNTSYREIILVSSLLSKLEIYINSCRKNCRF
jgi:integrase